MPRSHDPSDPSGLIREAYRITGITPIECRSIFFDWAVGMRGDVQTARADLRARYEAQFPEHPMTEVLREGDAVMAARKGRRGGRGAR